MSITLQKLVWKLNIHPSQKLVLVRLADYASDKTQQAYPSVASLAADTGLSERMVQRYLSASVDAGFVVVDDHQHGGRGMTRTYRFTLAKGDASDTVSERKRVTSKPVKGDAGDAVLPQQRVTSREKRVTPMTEKGDTHDGIYIRSEPSTNHQREPSVALPRNGDAQTLVAVLYEDVLGIGKPTNYKQAVGQASQLAKAGVTPDELREIAEWLIADPFWSQKGVNMGTVLSQRDKYRAARNAPVPLRRKVDEAEDDVWEAYGRAKGYITDDDEPADVIDTTARRTS